MSEPQENSDATGAGDSHLLDQLLGTEPADAPVNGMTTVEAALAYAQAGIPVFPVSPADKRPLIAHGFKGATRDEAQIRCWFEQDHPSAMIGAPTGRISGLYVLDVDGPEGRQNLKQLMDDDGFALGKPRIVKTPRGHHLHYADQQLGLGTFRSVAKIKVNDRKISNLDTRGDGGYIIMPPSRNAAGHSYLITTRVTKPSPPPEWLKRAVYQEPAEKVINLETEKARKAGNATAYARAALADEALAVSQEGKGSRNDRLNRAAFALGQLMKAGGLARDEIVAALKDAATKNGSLADDGEAQVLATINSGIDAGLRNPRGVPEPEKPKAKPGRKRKAKPGAETADDGPEEAKAGAWSYGLSRTPTDEPHPNLANVLYLLRAMPEWQGVFAYDELRYQYVLQKPLPHSGPMRELPGRTYPCEIEDRDMALVKVWMQTQGTICRLNSDAVVEQAVMCIAQENRFHPIRDWLKALKWDGISRIGGTQLDDGGCSDGLTSPSWLHTYIGAADDPYTCYVGQSTLVGAVARLMQPGCKLDTAPIFIGKQGDGKSTAIKVLFGEEYTTDQLAAFGSKDASMQLLNFWAIEWAEIDNLNKSESNEAKAFVARQFEDFRPPYGRKVIRRGRQCIFIGTTNEEVFLKDQTGNRRYYPVKIGGNIDLEALSRDREQLWAEAFHLYQAGVKWWADRSFERKHVQAQQELVTVEDAWTPLIAEYLKKQMFDVGNQEFTVGGILEHALGLSKDRWGTIENRRVTAILQTLGFSRGKRTSEKRVWVPGPDCLLTPKAQDPMKGNDSKEDAVEDSMEASKESPETEFDQEEENKAFSSILVPWLSNQPDKISMGDVIAEKQKSLGSKRWDRKVAMACMRSLGWHFTDEHWWRPRHKGR